MGGEGWETGDEGWKMRDKGSGIKGEGWGVRGERYCKQWEERGEGWGLKNNGQRVRGDRQGVRGEKWELRDDWRGVHRLLARWASRHPLGSHFFLLYSCILLILTGCIPVMHFGRPIFKSWLQAWGAGWCETEFLRISEINLTSYQRLYPVRIHQRNIEWHWDMNTVNTITHRNQLVHSCPMESKNKKLCEIVICCSRKGYWNFQGGGVGREFLE